MKTVKELAEIAADVVGVIYEKTESPADMICVVALMRHSLDGVINDEINHIKKQDKEAKV